MNRVVAGGVLAIILAVGGAAFWAGRHQSPTIQPLNCSNPAADELCPTDQWYQAYQEFDALNAEIGRDANSPAIKAIQEKQDRALGMQDRLKQAMPTGYSYDTKKRRWVRNPPQTVGGNPLPTAPVPVK